MKTYRGGISKATTFAVCVSLEFDKTCPEKPSQECGDLRVYIYLYGMNCVPCLLAPLTGTAYSSCRGYERLNTAVQLFGCLLYRVGPSPA